MTPNQYFQNLPIHLRTGERIRIANAVGLSLANLDHAIRGGYRGRNGEQLQALVRETGGLVQAWEWVPWLAPVFTASMRSVVRIVAREAALQADGLSVTEAQE